MLIQTIRKEMQNIDEIERADREERKKLATWIDKVIDEAAGWEKRGAWQKAIELYECSIRKINGTKFAREPTFVGYVRTLEKKKDEAIRQSTASTLRRLFEQSLISLKNADMMAARERLLAVVDGSKNNPWHDSTIDEYRQKSLWLLSILMNTNDIFSRAVLNEAKTYFTSLYGNSVMVSIDQPSGLRTRLDGNSYNGTCLPLFLSGETGTYVEVARRHGYFALKCDVKVTACQNQADVKFKGVSCIELRRKSTYGPELVSFGNMKETHAN